ncbi:lysosomal acid lipase/cholesteryl ester hydrolase-like [Mercenaria mercenaria]|uniref:lysosomal acid lipase/cholesteryl ester hydrolase-like n=1 Tax=Mercenaria mercenaria TaxID=6596 RepID=UPI00234EC48E|nr:lysosomal acid lipase/cholesteryl ester hydrolase-like [Mercenaria mercenaria]
MKFVTCISIFLILLPCLGGSCLLNPWKRKVSDDPEIHMNTTQLITSKGYPCEDYDVHTDDGYILDVQRIPHGRNQNRSVSGKPVVLLMHGLLSCSACWVENLVNESLGFILADAGFDVWLGNCRGNTYGLRHEKLNPDQKEFWEFSWDEMAKYDLPATVNKMLAITGAEQVYFVGHSQGGGVGYAAMSTDPDFAKKIKMFVPLAPAVYLDALTGPLRLLAPFSKDLDFIADLFGDGEILPNDKIFKWLAKDICTKEIPAFLCKNFLFVLCGFDEQQMNQSRVPVYIGQHPAGTSVQNINHFAQMVLTGKFQMYDFGAKDNMLKYNQTTPPVYDPSKVTVPTAMFSGTHDWLVAPSDVTKLLNISKTVIFKKVISAWEHLDFIWAMDAPKLCYNDIINLFNKY